VAFDCGATCRQRGIMALRRQNRRRERSPALARASARRASARRRGTGADACRRKKRYAPKLLTATRGRSPRAPAPPAPARCRAGGAGSRTAHELQCLDDEFDLADATGPELDVALVALAPALLANLAVHVAQAGIGIEVEILAEYEGRDQLLQIRNAISGERSRLEPRVALPGASP
jgi:hypothetical protein